MAAAHGASKPDFTAGIRLQDIRDGVPEPAARVTMM